MFRSKLLNDFDIENKVKNNYFNFFYISHKFNIIKDQVKYENNYSLKMFQLQDIISAIDLGISTNIIAAENMIRYCLYLLKRDIYKLKKLELMDLQNSLPIIIDKYKNINSNDNIDFNITSFEFKDYTINQLIEIQSIANELIKL